MVTGNEDGVKHGAMNVLYSLQHLGYVIPPQADCGWIGEAGPGPSYVDPGSGGPENDFTSRNTTFLTWNLMHLAACSRTRAASRPTEPALGVGRRLAVRLREPRATADLGWLAMAAALKVLFIGGSGHHQLGVLAACGRALGLDALRAQPRAHVEPAAARRACSVLRPTSATRPRVRAALGAHEFDAVVDWVAFTPEHVAGRHRPVRRAHRPVRVHQLGVGLPEAAGAAADHRVHAAAQPVLAVLARQDRLRGPAGARLPRGRLPGHDRAPLAHLRPHAACRCDGGWTVDRPHARAGKRGRRPRRRHVAVDADPPRRFRPGLRRRCSATRRRSATASTSPPTRC